MAGDRNHYWWLTNRKVVERYVREAKILIATQDQAAAALRLLEAALTLAPRLESALELKARSLLHLRRYKQVAEMLRDYIPSLKMASSDDAFTSSSGSSDGSSTHLCREQSTLLKGSTDEEQPASKCFSVSDLKRKVMSGLFRNIQKQGQWRYSVLGQACCHLGLMEEAMVLLQTGKRLATATSRRQSTSLTDDTFPSNKLPLAASSHPEIDADESISQLLCHIKLLVRRRAAASAALSTGLHSEAIRHFSKILDGRRRAPPAFLSECYVGRASAFRSAGRIADAIADCNRALALDASCIGALAIRATLFETINCLPDSLHDLEHLKLLYNSILRDRRLPGAVWKRLSVPYREIPGKLCSLATKMQQLKQRVAAGETRNVDYHALIGLENGCSRSELERAHLLLTLKHKPDRSSSFIEKCEFADDQDVDSVRDRGKMSALLLYRLIQKGYASVKATMLAQEAEEQRNKVVDSVGILEFGSAAISRTPPVFFCRDHISRSINIPVKYEGLSC